MDEDLGALRRAAESRPDDAGAWVRLASALSRSGAHRESLASARRALRIDPDLNEAASLERRAFPEVHRFLRGAELREVIGRALRLPGVFDESNETLGSARQVSLLGGTGDRDGEVVAFAVLVGSTELSSSPHRLELRFAGVDPKVRSVNLHASTRRFEAHVHHLHVRDERAVIVFSQPRVTVAAVVPFDGAPSFAPLGVGPFLVLPDRLIFSRADKRAIDVLSLPDLEPCTSLVVPGQITGPLRAVDDAVIIPVDGADLRAPLGPQLRPWG